MTTSTRGEVLSWSVASLAALGLHGGALIAGLNSFAPAPPQPEFRETEVSVQTLILETPDTAAPELTALRPGGAEAVPTAQAEALAANTDSVDRAETALDAQAAETAEAEAAARAQADQTLGAAASDERVEAADNSQTAQTSEAEAAARAQADQTLGAAASDERVEASDDTQTAQTAETQDRVDAAQTADTLDIAQTAANAEAAQAAEVASAAGVSERITGSELEASAPSPTLPETVPEPAAPQAPSSTSAPAAQALRPSQPAPTTVVRAQPQASPVARATSPAASVASVTPNAQATPPAATVIAPAPDPAPEPPDTPETRDVAALPQEPASPAPAPATPDRAVTAAPATRPATTATTVAPAPRVGPVSRAPAPSSAQPVAPQGDRVAAVALRPEPIAPAPTPAPPTPAPPEPAPPEPAPPDPTPAPAPPSEPTANEGRDGVAAPTQTIEERQEESRDLYAQVQDFLREYDGGSCFAALPSLSEEGFFQFETFAPQASLIDAFRSALQTRTGTLPGTAMKAISDAQCDALQFVQNSLAYPEFQLYFDLERRTINSGEKLEGTLGNTTRGFISLLLVDDEGFVQDLGSFLKFNAGRAIFSIQMNVVGSPVETQQLLMALATRTRLQTVEDYSGAPAKEFFLRLALELAQQGGSEDIALVAFSVR